MLGKSILMSAAFYISQFHLIFYLKNGCELIKQDVVPWLRRVCNNSNSEKVHFNTFMSL